MFLAPKRLIAFFGGDTVFFFIKFTLSDPLSRRQEKWYWFLLNRNHVRVSNGGYRRFACLEAFEVFQINCTLQSLTKLSRHVALTPTWDPVIHVKNGVVEQQHAFSTCDARLQDARFISLQKEMLRTEMSVSEISIQIFPHSFSLQPSSFPHWFLFHLLQSLPLSLSLSPHPSCSLCLLLNLAGGMCQL